MKDKVSSNVADLYDNAEDEADMLANITVEAADKPEGEREEFVKDRLKYFGLDESLVTEICDIAGQINSIDEGEDGDGKEVTDIDKDNDGDVDITIVEHQDNDDNDDDMLEVEDEDTSDNDSEVSDMPHDENATNQFARFFADHRLGGN